MARARPEDFLELVERSKGGRLKVYIGLAAGVGKTYRMLHEAHALKQRGVDVVLGFIETHGRAETAALIEGLEVVPRRQIEYRGVTVEEMDLDAVLARRPQVAIVDEVAHTNAPGSRHRKRYEDIQEMLDAGINVICAFNVQHLESLNDLIERVTGITVRETVPDTFLKHADQVVNLDLAVEDLIDRLKSGKIYAPDKVAARARELLHPGEAAQPARAGAARGGGGGRAGAGPAHRRAPTPRHVSGRVMVCMSSFSPRAAALLRRGSRFAGRLNTDWFVVYVETPAESPDRIDSAAQRHLLENIERAKEMGAEVVRLKGKDPVSALLDFARSHNVAYIMIGRSHRPRWKQVLGRLRRTAWCRRPKGSTSTSSPPKRTKTGSRDPPRPAPPGPASARAGRPRPRRRWPCTRCARWAPPPRTSSSDNYRSVLAAQRMKEASERIDSAALFIVAGQRREGASADRPRTASVFEAELAVEERNITEPGEKEAAARAAPPLGGLPGTRPTPSPASPPSRPRRRVLPRPGAALPGRQGRRRPRPRHEPGGHGAQERARPGAWRAASRWRSWLAAVFALGLAVAHHDAGRSRRALRPLNVLTHAVRRIGEKDFAARAPHRGHATRSRPGRGLQRHGRAAGRVRAELAGRGRAGPAGRPRRHREPPRPGGGVRPVGPDPRRQRSVADRPPPARGTSRPRAWATWIPLRGPRSSARAPTCWPDAAPTCRRATKRSYAWPSAAPSASSCRAAARSTTPSGAITGVAVTLQDVTRLRHFDELKTDLVATVAHEFRTPLTSLRMAIHLLPRAGGGPADREAGRAAARRARGLRADAGDGGRPARPLAHRRRRARRPSAAGRGRGPPRARRWTPSVAAAAEAGVDLRKEVPPGLPAVDRRPRTHPSRARQPHLERHPPHAARAASVRVAAVEGPERARHACA